MGDPEDPAYERAIRDLERRGLERGRNFSDGQITCDRGARKALQAEADDMAVAVYFDTETAARAFGEQLDEPPEGIARVRTYCAD